jgi:two-component system response regulator ResD
LTIASDPTHHAPPPELSGGVLVVEDDRSVQQLIRLTLEAEGHSVESAGNTTAALESAAVRWPDLLVLDMGLPAHDGAWLVDTLRDTYGKVPPVLLVTADGDVARKAHRVGAFHYLTKPFDLLELASAVQDGLSIEAATP